MIGPPADAWTGSVRWAVLPFAPKPPVRLYAGERHAPIVVSDAAPLIAAAESGGDPELTYLVAAKARPVLIVSRPAARHDQELVALRLLPLSKLTPEEQHRIRAQEDELLFHLAPARFDLPEESAAMVSALVRVDVDAVEAGPPLGHLAEHELRVLGERVIRFLGLDTRLLVERALQELAARRREREAE